MPPSPAVPTSPALRVTRVEGAPVVAIRVVLVGGARVELAPSTALLAGRLLAEGTGRRDHRALAEAVESLGASLSSFGGYESIGVAVDALAADWERALELAAEVLFEPAFPEERLTFLARQAAAELEALADQADAATALEFSRQLYGAHARGRPLQGSAASLAALDPAACRRFHAESLARGGVVVVAGAIDPDAVARAAAAAFAALPPPAAPPPPAAIAPPRRAVRRQPATRARDQVHLFVGQISVARADPDFTALELAGVVLGAGAGLTGRIPQRVREQEGLAYHATAECVAGASIDPGRAFAYAGTSPDLAARAERAMLEELERFVAEGPTAREVDEARAYLLGREPFRRETARQRAELEAQSALLGLPLHDAAWVRAELAAPSRADVAAALGRRLDPARLARVVGRPRRALPRA